MTHVLRRLLLIHLDCYEHLLMDSHPPARRPHKSPAHTVKDLRNRPQRLIPWSAPKCLTEPHILHQIPGPSTSRHTVFAAPPRSSPAAGTRTSCSGNWAVSPSPRTAAFQPATAVSAATGLWNRAASSRANRRLRARGVSLPE